MHFNLKSATLAAFALTASAAAIASDPSLAGAMVASNDKIPVTIDAPKNAPAASSLHSGPVRFAAPAEVVQPLLPAATPADGVSIAPEPAATLSELVADHGDAETLDGDMRCLAGAVYFESKGESLDGQLAVARVIINRAKSGRFAGSLCGVVFQRGQFSFVRGSSMPPIPMSSRGWREAVAISQIAMAGNWKSEAEGALYFHARRVSPGWGRQRMAAIDNHVFYR
jgi:hypothetical protein